MPALQKALDHFDAMPSSLTGISFLSQLILHAEPGKPDDCFYSFFYTTALTGIKKTWGADPHYRKTGGHPYEGSDFTSR